MFAVSMKKEIDQRILSSAQTEKASQLRLRFVLDVRRKEKGKRIKRKEDASLRCRTESGGEVFNKKRPPPDMRRWKCAYSSVRPGRRELR